MDKYEYLAGEGLGYNPGVVERVRFEYSPLGEALYRTKCKTYNNKVVSKNKRDKFLSYNS